MYSERVITEIVLSNIPLITLILALFFGAATLLRHRERVSNTFVYDTFSGYILFFVVGITCLWAFCMNVFLLSLLHGHPHWTLTGGPFQLVTAGASLGLGIAGLLSLRESFSFKTAVTIMATPFFWSSAIEDTRRLSAVDGYHHGSSFYIAILVPILLIILLLAQHQAEKNHRP